VLRTLARVARGAEQNRKPLCVCGEVAHEADFLPFLLGIGVRRFSVDPQFMPAMQSAINAMHLKQAEGYARRLLAAATVAQANALRSAWRGLRHD
jgi:phosphotransferase system enzyme I (PtsP)